MGDRPPKATTAEEAALRTFGPGAAAWPVQAAAAGTRRTRARTAEAVALSKLHSAAEIDREPGAADSTGRFSDKDLLSVLDHQVGLTTTEPTRRGEDRPAARHRGLVLLSAP